VDDDLSAMPDKDLKWWIRNTKSSLRCRYKKKHWDKLKKDLEALQEESKKRLESKNKE